LSREAEQCNGEPRRSSGRPAGRQREAPLAFRPSAIGERGARRAGARCRRWDRSRRPPPARLDVCPRGNQNCNGKGGDGRRAGGERWLVQRGQLLTAVFSFVFYNLFFEKTATILFLKGSSHIVVSIRSFAIYLYPFLYFVPFLDKIIYAS
jgi:hypothetical protein